jgi:hypothetical protein
LQQRFPGADIEPPARDGDHVHSAAAV